MIDLFDTHAHLHFPHFADDLPATLDRASAAGVGRLVNIGTDVTTSRASIALAGAHQTVWATVGVHPTHAAEVSEADLAEIERLASVPRVVAIGEMGLDFFHQDAPRDVQERIFRWQLDLCRRLGKPAVIHCRDAYPETLAILGDERVADVGGVMHCFLGGVDIARRCLDLNLVISMAGPVTYPSSRQLPDVVRAVPADRLVVETDCPFLPPQGHRGKRNEPAYVALTAARVAELRGEPLEALAERTTENGRRLFRVP
jgi:TatD DNase family protein